MPFYLTDLQKETLWRSAQDWLNTYTTLQQTGLVSLPDCKCCSTFRFRHTCGDCPIMYITGKPSCQGTPFQRVSGAEKQLALTKSDSGIEFFQAILHEEIGNQYEFLVNLALND